MRSFSYSVFYWASLVVVVACSGTTDAQDDLTPMFSGNDLSGWVLTNTPPETWKFQDGVLYCTGKPIGEIRTAKMYQNFVMELEWRHMVPGGNAGVFVWADDITSRGVPFHRGIEVQVLENAYGDTASHTTHGDIFPIHGATMKPENGRGGGRAFPTELRSKPSPEWNHYRIECRDGEISLAVNGKVVTRGKECVPRKGYICLESEGGVVEYRNVKIQELESTPISAEHVAIADRGYRSLYTGLNLDGWKASAENSKRWQVNDWVLSFNGDERESETLTTTESFSELSFIVDVRMKKESSSLVIDAGTGRQLDLASSEASRLLEAAGKWSRIEGNHVNGKYTWTINGQSLSGGTAATENEKSKLALTPTGPVDLANLYVRDAVSR
jgi:Domain of Unknown Function (DUF1080)